MTKTVVITGASSGIGAELAKIYNENSWRVVLLARRKDRLEALAASLRSPEHAVIYTCDVTDPRSVQECFADMARKNVVCDLLIANAGTGINAKPCEINVAAVRSMFELNVLAVIECIAQVLPAMRARKQGHIAVISSLAAYRSFPGTYGYCATKSAISAFMEGLRPELKAFGIDATTICPGFIVSELTAKNTFSMPFLLPTRKASEKIYRAILRKKKVYNFPWQTRFLSALSRLLPDSMLMPRPKIQLKPTSGVE